MLADALEARWRIKKGSEAIHQRRDAGGAAARRIAVAWPPRRHDSRFRSHVWARFLRRRHSASFAFGNDSRASQRIKLEHEPSIGIPDCDCGAKRSPNLQHPKTVLRAGRTRRRIYDHRKSIILMRSVHDLRFIFDCRDRFCCPKARILHVKRRPCSKANRNREQARKLDQARSRCKGQSTHV
jgi:hypothetical protein